MRLGLYCNHFTWPGDETAIGPGMVEREPQAMQRWCDMGVRFLVWNNDGNMVYQSAARDVAALRKFAT